MSTVNLFNEESFNSLVQQKGLRFECDAFHDTERYMFIGKEQQYFIRNYRNDTPNKYHVFQYNHDDYTFVGCDFEIKGASVEVGSVDIWESCVTEEWRDGRTLWVSVPREPIKNIAAGPEHEKWVETARIVASAIVYKHLPAYVDQKYVAVATTVLSSMGLGAVGSDSDLFYKLCYDFAKVCIKNKSDDKDQKQMYDSFRLALDKNREAIKPYKSL